MILLSLVIYLEQTVRNQVNQFNVLLSTVLFQLGHHLLQRFSSTTG